MGYSFHFHRANSVPDITLADCRDDEEAMSMGERLLAAHADADGVEVVHDGEEVGKARRPWITRMLGGRTMGGETRPFVFPG